jgi:hypothetical protein
MSGVKRTHGVRQKRARPPSVSELKRIVSALLDDLAGAYATETSRCCVLLAASGDLSWLPRALRISSSWTTVSSC